MLIFIKPSWCNGYLSGLFQPGKGRLCPPITTGTPNFFDLSAFLDMSDATLAFKTWWGHYYIMGIICPPGWNRVKVTAKIGGDQSGTSGGLKIRVCQ